MHLADGPVLEDRKGQDQPHGPTEATKGGHERLLHAEVGLEAPHDGEEGGDDHEPDRVDGEIPQEGPQEVNPFDLLVLGRGGGWGAAQGGRKELGVVGRHRAGDALLCTCVQRGGDK